MNEPTLCVNCAHLLNKRDKPGHSAYWRCTASVIKPERPNYQTGGRLPPIYAYCEEKNKEGKCEDFEQWAG